MTETTTPAAPSGTVGADVRCQCCGGPGPNTHMVAAEGYAGLGCQDCATLAVKLGGHVTRLKRKPNAEAHASAAKEPIA